MFKTIKLTPKEDAMFQPGCFVMLHTESCVASGKLHPDAGRIGQIVSRRGSDMLVEFFADELFGKSDFCMIPLGHWAPVPRFLVEEYEPRAKKRGWRLNASGVQVYRELGWAQTPATIGENHVDLKQRQTMAMDAKAMQTGRNEKMCQQVNGHLEKNGKKT